MKALYSLEGRDVMPLVFGILAARKGSLGQSLAISVVKAQVPAFSRIDISQLNLAFLGLVP
jgi:hypothetical protein